MLLPLIAVRTAAISCWLFVLTAALKPSKAFIESKEEIIQMLGAGATAVSTGRPELWDE